MRIRKRTRAGAIRFSAVPPMVWSARKLMEAKESSREKMAPIIAAMTIAISSKPCKVA